MGAGAQGALAGGRRRGEGLRPAKGTPRSCSSVTRTLTTCHVQQRALRGVLAFSECSRRWADATDRCDGHLRAPEPALDQDRFKTRFLRRRA